MAGLIRSKMRYAIAGWGLSKDWDTVSTPSRYSELEKNDPETGMMRLKKMFSTDIYNSLSAELEQIIQVTIFGAFIGGAIGGFLQSKEELLSFMENNEASKFRNQYEAKRLVQDNVVLGFAKGAIKWGSKVALFCGTFVTVSTMISVYRGKTSVLEYSIGGCTAGALYKLPLGPKGMCSGGLVGAIFGTVCGIMTIIIIKLSGTTLQDVRNMHYQYASSIEDEKKLEVLKKYRMKEAEQLMKNTHQKFVSEESSEM